MNLVTLEFARLIHLASAVIILSATVAVWLPSRRQSSLCVALFATGFATLSAEALIRTVLSSRAPVVGTYENTLVVAAMLSLAVAIVLVSAAPSVKLLLARLVAPWALVSLAYGSRFSAEILPAGAEGRGALAYAHAFVGWLDFTVLLVAAMAAVGLLLDRRGDARMWQPVLTRSLGAGFALLTATMASGALLSFAVFGSWYQWQIAETLAAALWLAYGFVLHAYLLFGWRDRRLAGLVLVLLPLALGAFWSWSLYSGTYHFFERILGE